MNRWAGYCQQEVVNIPYQKAVLDGKKIKGTISILDVQYGNIWTNIPAVLFNQFNVKVGEKLDVTIYNNKVKKYQAICLTAKRLLPLQKESHWLILIV